MIGSVVGQYQILAKIGEGGMGAVYRAVDQMLQREVAIKVLRPELARQTAVVERFRTEAVALARLNHPNIATVHGLLRQEDEYFMILEYVEGDTLEQRLYRSGRLEWREAAAIAAEVLGALDHAHRMGVVHRDLKPANLMLTRNGAVKVMDFGIARLAGTHRHTEYGRIVGTPLYMSPEQLRGEEVDGRSDVYSLGVVLFELLTGREAFQADSDYALLMAQLNQAPDPPSRFVSDLPAGFDAVLERAMAKRREDRYPTAPAFKKALEELLARHPVPEPAPIVAPEPEDGAVKATRLADSAVEVPVRRTRLAEPESPSRRSEPHAPSAEPTKAPRRNVWVMAVGGAALVAVMVWAITSLRSTPGARTGETVAASVPSSSPSPVPAPAPLPPPSVSPTPAPPVPVNVASQPAPRSGAGGGSTIELPTDRGIPRAEGAAETKGAGGTERKPSGGREGTAKKVDSVNPAPETAAKPDHAPEEAPPSNEASADMAALREGAGQVIRQLSTLLKERSTALTDALYSGNGEDDQRNKEALRALLKKFPVELDKESLMTVVPSGTSTSRAEYTATLKWRSSFGNTRKATVRLMIGMSRDGGNWRVKQWRFVGRPDLD